MIGLTDVTSILLKTDTFLRLGLFPVFQLMMIIFGYFTANIYVTLMDVCTLITQSILLVWYKN